MSKIYGISYTSRQCVGGIQLIKKNKYTLHF